MTTQTETHALHIERTFAAPIDQVHAAITKGSLVAKWFAPGDMTAEVHSYDARVGGQFEISMHGKDDDGKDATHTCTGTFHEVGPTRVAMSFNWTSEPLANDTTLALELQAVEGGTKLVLTHEGFAKQEAATMHEEGWAGCLINLDAAL